jgi:hypothetical protein
MAAVLPVFGKSCITSRLHQLPDLNCLAYSRPEKLLPKKKRPGD